MKNLIMFFVLVMVMVFSNYEVSYSQETGNFYFLIGTEGNERAIMYLHIVGNEAYGSYYTESQSIIDRDRLDRHGDSGFSGSFDGKNLKLSYHDDNDRERMITGSLSSDIVFRGKHNSKNVNLSLANTPINSASIVRDRNIDKLIFNVKNLDNKVNNLDYYYYTPSSYYQSIIYLDSNIICISTSDYGENDYMESKISTYSINTGKRIDASEFINVNNYNFLNLLSEKNIGYSGDFNHSESFGVLPNGKIRFYYDSFYWSYVDEDGEGTGGQANDFLADLTFEELKPFIKRGSPLDYLFN